MKFVSINRVISSVSRNLGINDITTHEQSIIEWSFEAEKFIGGLNSFVKLEKDLTITDYRASLPDNIVKVLSVKHGETILKPTHSYFRGNATGVDADTDSTGDSSRYYIQDGYINVRLDNGSKITVSVLSIPVDADGYPKINESHIEAVTAYCMWMIKNIEYYNGKTPQYVVNDLQKRWYYLCGQARGVDGMPSSSELTEIASYWNTLIPIKSKNGLKNL